MTFAQLLLGVRDPIRGRAVFDPVTAAAGITGGASLLGGILGSNSADKAADASAQAAADSNATQLEMFYQGRADLAPQRQASQNALAAMQYELGLGPLPYFSSNPTVSDNGDIEGVRYSVNGEVPLFGGPDATSAISPQGAPAYATSPGGNAFANVGTNSTIPAFNPLDYPDEGGGAVNAFQHYLANLGEAVAGRPAFQPTMGASYGAPAAQQQTAGGTGQDTGTLGFAYGGFKETPGYQFRLSEGLGAAADYSAARGLGLSGAALKEQQRIGEGMAASEYGDYWNRLASTAGLGQTASSASAQLGQNYAGAVGTNNAFAAAGQGSAYGQQANAWGGALGGVAGALGDWLGSQQTTPQNAFGTVGGGYIPGSFSRGLGSIGTGYF